jgi:hypothetical protein
MVPYEASGTDGVCLTVAAAFRADREAAAARARERRSPQGLH